MFVGGMGEKRPNEVELCLHMHLQYCLWRVWQVAVGPTMEQEDAEGSWE